MGNMGCTALPGFPASALGTACASNACAYVSLTRVAAAEEQDLLHRWYTWRNGGTSLLNRVLAI